jgi:hypothetical protein
MGSIRFAVCCCAALVFTTTVFAKDITFEAGYPTPEASEALYDEMDYQRAVQA